MYNASLELKDCLINNFDTENHMFSFFGYLFLASENFGMYFGYSKKVNVWTFVWCAALIYVEL